MQIRLTEHHEADGIAQVTGCCHGLDDSVAALSEHAGSEAEQDHEPVDLPCACVLIHTSWNSSAYVSAFGHAKLTKEHPSNQSENTADNVPRLEVIEARNQMPTCQNHACKTENEREQAHSRHDRIVASSELEVQRNVVNRDEAGSVHRRSDCVEEYRVPVPHEVCRKYSIRKIGQEWKALLNAQQNK